VTALLLGGPHDRMVLALDRDVAGFLLLDGGYVRDSRAHYWWSVRIYRWVPAGG
jgi:hypothetical protein